MRVKKLVNTSNEVITIRHTDGVESRLPPGAEVNDVSITNEHEIERKARITVDLTEVTEEGTKTKLYD
jgi:hypothetical protein